LTILGTSVFNTDPAEKFDPLGPAFQVSQGHWHRSGSIDYLWLHDP